MNSRLGDLALCYGTRPQIIKASLLRQTLARRWSVRAIDTGQHYDYALNELLYSQLGVSPPDEFLEVGSGTHAHQTASILRRCETALRSRVPRAVVVIGDTNSTLGATLAAVKLRVPVVHVEAGLRAADPLMAEEINRRAVDAVASVLCAPSRAAADTLRRERPGARVAETGDIARDVLLAHEQHLPPLDTVIPGWGPRAYVYSTLHRAELTDNVPLLREVLGTLGQLPIPVVLAMHPRTREALGPNEPSNDFGPALRVLPPIGYLESLALTRAAAVVITDSGGLQREAYWLGVPCITLRVETEWSETVMRGANHLLDPFVVRSQLSSMVGALNNRRDEDQSWDRDAYGSGNAASRIAQALAEFLEQS
jgi:UDP-GlcNAc3NAcA epimerase